MAVIQLKLTMHFSMKPLLKKLLWSILVLMWLLFPSWLLSQVVVVELLVEQASTGHHYHVRQLCFHDLHQSVKSTASFPCISQPGPKKNDPAWMVTLPPAWNLHLGTIILKIYVVRLIRSSIRNPIIGMDNWNGYKKSQ